ncbi:MAG: hypothetical protein IJM90_05410 [Firmicutes bacterium]|nr:hypothetical protein [Bacillota bacterium]
MFDYANHLKDLELNDSNLTDEKLREVLNSIGYVIESDREFGQNRIRIEALLKQKGTVYLHDLYFLLQKGHFVQKEDSVIYILKNFRVVSSDEFPEATIRLVHGTQTVEEHSYGSGPIDALYTAIKNAVHMDFQLLAYRISSVSSGKDAQGRVSIELEYDGEIYSAQSTDTDIIKASAIALLNGVNNILISKANSKDQ